MDRTKLANERTLLAYGRTALAFIVLAVFVFRFMPSVLGVAIALSSLILGGGIMYVGWRNYRAISARVSELYQSSDVDE